MDAHPAAGRRTGLLGGTVVRRARERRAEVPSPLRQGRCWVARSRPPHLRPLCPHNCRGLAELELPAMPAVGLCVFPPTSTSILVVRESSPGFNASCPLGTRPRSGPPAFSPGLVSAVGQLCLPWPSVSALPLLSHCLDATGVFPNRFQPVRQALLRASESIQRGF